MIQEAAQASSASVRLIRFHRAWEGKKNLIVWLGIAE